jgi:hypothetical protein
MVDRVFSGYWWLAFEIATAAYLAAFITAAFFMQKWEWGYWFAVLAIPAAFINILVETGRMTGKIHL